MDRLKLPQVFETAARAAINERCAAAFLHDVRGTMQAVFSAFELLGRSARAGAVDASRVEKACDLARRAIQRHENSTLDVLQCLSLQRTEPTRIDLGTLVEEITHLLRNEAATNQVVLTLSAAPDVGVHADLPKLQTLLIGLMTAAIDATPNGGELPLSVASEGSAALLCIGSDGGFDPEPADHESLQDRLARAHPRELTLLFARQFVAAHDGRLDIDATTSPRGELRFYLPRSALG